MSQHPGARVDPEAERLAAERRAEVRYRRVRDLGADLLLWVSLAGLLTLFAGGPVAWLTAALVGGVLYLALRRYRKMKRRWHARKARAPARSRGAPGLGREPSERTERAKRAGKAFVAGIHRRADDLADIGEVAAREWLRKRERERLHGPAERPEARKPDKARQPDERGQ